MKKYLHAIILSLLVAGLYAQPYGNEWIEYSQRYYKIPIAEPGVYRITFNDLANAGIPISGINPNFIQMFAATSEVPIYIAGESDGVFNSNDFIEFVGKPNTGALESVLYPTANAHANDEYSLFNDTLYYFLTWTNQGGNARITTETDQNFGAFTPANFVWKFSQVVFSNNYYQGEIDAYGVSSSRYSEGEGWMSGRFGIPQGASSLTTNVPTAGIYTGPGAPAAQAFSVSAGASNAAAGGQNNHHLQIRYGSGNTLAINHLFVGYKVNRFNFAIPNAAIAAPTTPIRHEVVNDLGVPSDYQAVAKVGITYPHQLDLGAADYFQFQYQLNPSQNKTRFDFENLSGSTPTVYTDGNPARRVPLVLDENKWKGLIPNNFDPAPFDCYLVTSASIKPIPSISIAANNGFFTNFGQSQIDSAFVIIAHPSLFLEAQNYANYRQQRFSTVLANVEELYDQFGGGVRKSALALRNFSRYLLDTWANPPQYMLLLGKSVRDAREGNVAGSRQNANLNAQNLVPSLGYPPSDNLITAGLGSTNFEPAIRTGRVSARNGAEVMWYLNKLQEFEGQVPAAWMKNVMHFGGGTTQNEQQNFAFYLSTYEVTVEDSSFGGNVYTYLKDTSAPIQINASQEITQVIEEGTSLLTFFGHATSNSFDQSIDDPQNFNWNGRYPLLLGNSCYTGDYHAPGNLSTSEQYTILDGKGTIGFIASVKLGFEPYLNIYSREFYRQFSLLNYGGTLGDHHRNTVAAIQFSLGPQPNLFMENTCLGVGLQGDPAIVLNSFPQPDLSIAAQDVFFTPDEITAEIDSFTVNVVVTNIARGTNQPFSAVIEHNPPDGGEEQVYVRTMNGLLFRDTIRIKVPIDPIYGLGVHNFDVLVDLPENAVEELPGFESVNNVVLGKQLVISNGGAVPIYPQRFAVVGSPGVQLHASTGDPLADEMPYRIEIDTTDTFDSPALLATTVSQSGGVISWTPQLAYPDSMVYFWRVAPFEEELQWRESSFQYIPDRSGWGQAHIFQFKDNNFFQTEFNRPARRVDFFTGTVRLSNSVFGNDFSAGNDILLNQNLVEYGACTTAPSLHMAVFDPITFEAWGTNFGGENPDNDFGNANANGGGGCRQRVERFFIFRQGNPTQVQALADVLLDETIPDGHYVLLYSIRYVSYDDWDNTPDIYDAFASMGAQMIGSEGAQDSVSFSLLVRKGDPTFIHELYGTSITDSLFNIVDIPASGNSGTMSTGRIGPATNWQTASWQTFSPDVAIGDSASFRLIGIDPSGQETPLTEAVFDPSQVQSVNIQSYTDAATHPMLRIEASLRDGTFNTPLQIDRWHVLYDPVPEAAVDPNTHFVFTGELLQQGEEGLLSVAIRNVSDLDMDSLLVKYWIEDSDRNIISLEYPRQDSLKGGTVLIDTVRFDTRNLSGSNSIWIEVNPIDPVTGVFDQPEQTHFNNLMRVPFQVGVDNVNPILDVTFDGVHILNGEIVAPRPEILIALKDENPFLLMNDPADTSLFKVFIAPPGGEYQRYFFNAPGSLYQMDFIPAVDEKNQAKIMFRPSLENDGKYKMLVQATDASGNNSGSIDYRIDFEVINRPTITEVLNYPNPFTTSTQFIFTLTGSEIPDEFKIQIMTVTGRVVREITQAEFGPIRIGRNASVYRWDGRDEFGDRLANGVYLYRVISRLNGESIELRDGGASEFFTKGFGKMYMMR